MISLENIYPLNILSKKGKNTEGVFFFETNECQLVEIVQRI
jgi:hypothetical protein